MKVFSSFACVCSAIVLLVSSGLAQQKNKFEYGYKQGKTYRYAETGAGNVTQEMMGREMKIETKSRVVMRYDIANVSADGSMTLVYSADSMVVATKSSMLDTTMVLKDLIGKHSSIRVAKDGAISEKKIIDSVAAAGRMMGMGSVSTTPRFTKFSAHPVAQGEKWTATVTDSSNARGMTTVTSTAYEYSVGGEEQKLGHACRVFTYTGAGTITGKGSMQGMDLFIDGTSKAKGTVYFDAALGLLVAEELRMENESTIAVTGAQSMTIPQSTVVTMTRALKGE